MMQAITISEFGGPEVLQLATRAIPDYGDYEVLIKVRAAGINRPDVIQRKGHYPAPAGVPADIPGLEVAGVIEHIGAKVTKWAVGDEVMALIGGGGYAEYVPNHEALCLPKPKRLSFVEAASLPETIYTVWSNVFERAQLRAGENFLVHGGSGGIGITALQLALAMGAKVFTTVGSEEKKAFCAKLGATTINYTTEDFAQCFSEMDVVLDCIGGTYFAKNIDVLRPEGRLVYINAMGGVKVELNLLKLMQKRIHITGSTLRTREHEYKAALTERIKGAVLPLIEQGKFIPIIAEVFPLAQACDAHALMESSAHIGKIILTP